MIFIQRHVTTDRLPDFLPEVTQLLFDHLTAARGVLSGPVFVARCGSRTNGEPRRPLRLYDFCA